MVLVGHGSILFWLDSWDLVQAIDVVLIAVNIAESEGAEQMHSIHCRTHF